jgi:excisionase family DNA binding protein
MKTCFISRQQAAEQLSISLRTLDSLVKKKEIECYRIRRHVRFSQVHIDEYLARVTQRAVEPQSKPESKHQPSPLEDSQASKQPVGAKKGKPVRRDVPARKMESAGELQVFAKFAKGAVR